VPFNDFDDLKGKIVGVVSSTTQSKLARTLKGLKVVISFKTEAETLAALKLGKVNATLGDFFGAISAIKINPDFKKSKILVEERVAMAVKKGNYSLLNAVNIAFSNLLDDGTYRAITNKFFGQDIRCP
jgi:polar amino acid transport system substrate-binding protein